MDEKMVVEMIRQVVKEELKGFATKEDLERFATKEDLERFATKEDLDLLREDMKSFATKEDLDFLRGELKYFATKEDLILLRNDLASRIEGTQRGVEMLFKQIGQEFGELRAKLELYDFNYLVRQNDRLTAIYETLRQEQIVMGDTLKRHDTELKALRERIK